MIGNELHLVLYHDEEIVQGCKGPGFLGSGYVYAPYVPLYVSDSLELPLRPPHEVSCEVRGLTSGARVSIHKEPRKLRAVWSHEKKEDMASLFDPDQEARVASAMASEVRAAVDREFLVFAREPHPLVVGSRVHEVITEIEEIREIQERYPRG